MAAAAERARTAALSRRSAMPSWLRIANAALLFLCCSMYFGTGWSMGLFSFPIRPQLTVDNYYLVFVPEVAAATRFFTYMTSVMMISAAVMIFTEWRSPLRAIPIIVLVAVVMATVLTIVWIFPYNDAMTAGIKDPAVLADTLKAWMDLNWVRIALWSVQWAAMMLYFAVHSAAALQEGAA
jgi:hypothetical protein